ncbi:MAG: SLATT domain-containing protein [Methanofollis sp.]|uniref:SLATT domain-containing protein n=1 Tax=Methanofollis sp. TaxID=2052835 RepID=UPI0026116C8F|nr:SLATT domain-containing protein [Methanofollis sp.]MDD4255029.1 SLATT domain-containing protein [Methanofollis sp.]
MDVPPLPLVVRVGVAGEGDPAPVLAYLDRILASTPHTYLAVTTGVRVTGIADLRTVGSAVEVVEACDLLVAFTDDAVAVARAAGRTFFFVTPTGAVTAEHHADHILETLRFFDTYNGESVDPARVRVKVAGHESAYRAALLAAGLDPALLDEVAGSLLPYYARTRILADHYGSRHRLAGSAVYALSSAAIAVVAVQALLLPAWPALVWLEVAAIACVLLLLIAGRTLDWHRRWLDYRFLAERIRSAIFLCFVCITCELPDRPPLTLSPHADDWLSRAFESLVESRPQEYCSLAMPFEPLKAFLLEAWLARQIDWYAQKAQKNRRRHEDLLYAGEIFFIATLIAAAAHASGVGHPYTTTLTIVLPAVAAGLAAIRTQQEYRPMAERASRMLRHLSALSLRIRRAGDMPALCALLAEANEMMLREQQEWRVAFRFRELETP